MIRRIKKAAVIGSGVMGSGIAALLASAGVDTLLLDIVPNDLSENDKKDPKVRNRIVTASLDAVLKAKPPVLMHPEDAARIAIGNLEDDFDKLGDSDWIVEVVVERLDIKQDLLKKVDNVRKKGAIVTTNTSGIPLQAISEGLSLDFRRHFMGTHFFNPVRHMHLFELIAGQETLPEVLKFMADFGERRLGKGIVWAKDTPGFVGNRVGIFDTGHAMQTMLEEGLSIPEVDALLGPFMGRPKTATFRLADLVGIDVMGHVCRNTHELVADDEDRDRLVVPDFVTRMIEKNILGNKTRGGFYKKEKGPHGQKVTTVINPDTLVYEDFTKPDFPCLKAAKKAGSLSEKIKSVVYGDDKGARYAWKVLAGTLIYAAKRVPQISDAIVEIDNAVKWGFNHQLGPFEAWDAIGVARSVAKMEAEGMQVPENVKKMLAAGNASFYKTEAGKVMYYDFASGAYKTMAVSKEAVKLQRLKDAGKAVKSCASGTLVDLGDDIYCCEFHTKMNTLNLELMEFTNDCLDYVDANGAGLVIGNQAGGIPGAFSAGANLSIVLAAAKAGHLDGVALEIQTLQRLMQKFRYSSFPVVAAPYGLALGGGAEVCLGADRIVAHAELYIGLVEVGVGLLPSGGGCLNLYKKLLGNLPEAAADVDLSKFFLPAFMNIATAKVSTSAADARAKGFLGPGDRIVFNRDHLIGEAKKEVMKMVDDGYVPPLKKKLTVFGEAAQGMINAQLSDMAKAKFVSEYDAVMAKRIARVISGGDVRSGQAVDEDVILNLERETFLGFLKEEKTLERIEHMLKTGKPLRN